MIDSKEVRWCWLNGIFISPTAISNIKVRIDAYRVEDGRLVTLRQGSQIFNQKTEKDKKELYDKVYEVYEFYYNKLNKDEIR